MQVSASGIISRAETATNRANLTFPSLTPLSDGTILATLRAGPTKDSAAERIELYRSVDGGLNWTGAGSPFTLPEVGGKQGTLKLCYITELSPGRLLAAAMWVDRTSYPGQAAVQRRDRGLPAHGDRPRQFRRQWPNLVWLAARPDAGGYRAAQPHQPDPQARGWPAGDEHRNQQALPRRHEVEATRGLSSTHPMRGMTWSAPVTIAEDPTGRIFNWDLRCAVAPDGAHRHVRLDL